MSNNSVDDNETEQSAIEDFLHVSASKNIFNQQQAPYHKHPKNDNFSNHLLFGLPHIHS